MLNLPLKINQSLESKYPLVVPLADDIDRLGVDPPVDDIGAVAVTAVTVPPEGALLVMVKFGYVPVTAIPLPAVKATT